MTNSFWALCNHALSALHRHDHGEAISRLKDAESMLDHGLPAAGYLDKRKNHLAQLWRYAGGLATIQSAPLSEKKQDLPHLNGQERNLQGIAAAGRSAVPDDRAARDPVDKVRLLERQNASLVERLRSMPSIDPLCISAPDVSWPMQGREEFGIVVFGHTRLDTLNVVLESLNRQGALRYTEVWLDGSQGNYPLTLRIDKTCALVEKYPVKALRRQAGQFGFRKMLILGLVEMCSKYEDILILEDDCFPTRDAVVEFRRELDTIRENESVFSVYGHHFLVESEKETCPRFQGWGWATNRRKLMPILRQLIDCYSMNEERYLEFVELTLTPEIRARIDVTPPRQPSHTLEKFFAWDETVCLLTALNGLVHRPTTKRTIYNCGMGEDSTHFQDSQMFRAPAFNLITPNEVWRYF